MIDPVLNTPTVVTDADAKFINAEVGRPLTDDIKLHFISAAQLEAFLSLMDECGFDSSELIASESNNYPNLELSDRPGRPTMTELSGVVHTQDLGDVEVRINPGVMINRDRLEQKRNPIGQDVPIGDRLTYWRGPFDSEYKLIWIA